MDILVNNLTFATEFDEPELSSGVADLTFSTEFDEPAVEAVLPAPDGMAFASTFDSVPVELVLRVASVWFATQFGSPALVPVTGVGSIDPVEFGTGIGEPAAVPVLEVEVEDIEFATGIGEPSVVPVLDVEVDDIEFRTGIGEPAGITGATVTQYFRPDVEFEGSGPAVSVLGDERK